MSYSVSSLRHRQSHRSPQTKHGLVLGRCNFRWARVVHPARRVSYSQTSGTAPTSPIGFFANVDLGSQNPGDFTNVSVTYPGPGSPLSLTQGSPSFFGSGPGFPTQAAMNAAFPFGTYQYTATNTGVSNTATLNYSSDAFTSAIPALSAASFSALQGLNPATSLAINFNSFTPSASASEGFSFFTIFNNSGTAFADGLLAPGTTSLLLPADTLAACVFVNNVGVFF